MKTEDFERLKAVCEKEGFELFEPSNIQDEPIYMVRKKKDPWDGVEFAEYVYLPRDGRTCFKIERYKGEKLYMTDGSELFKVNCKPSTKSAYIEQLKKESFERFGEIKEGDMFDRTPIDEKWGPNVVMEKSPFGNFFWKYDKSSDTLFIGRYGIYSKGKWATRVKERVEVKWKSSGIDSDCMAFRFDISGNHKTQYGYEEGTYLASQLEEYLNK